MPHDWDRLGGCCNSSLMSSLSACNIVATNVLYAFVDCVGMPYDWVKLGSPEEPTNASQAVTSQWGSFGVEFHRLSQLTRDDSYWQVDQQLWCVVVVFVICT